MMWNDLTRFLRGVVVVIFYFFRRLRSLDFVRSFSTHDYINTLVSLRLYTPLYG